MGVVRSSCIVRSLPIDVPRLHAPHSFRSKPKSTWCRNGDTKRKHETVPRRRNKLKFSPCPPFGVWPRTNDKNAAAAAAEQQKLEPASRTLFYYIVIVVWIQSSELGSMARAVLQTTAAMSRRRITCISCYTECIVTSWQENFKSGNEHKAPAKSSSHQNGTEKTAAAAAVAPPAVVAL